MRQGVKCDEWCDKHSGTLMCAVCGCRLRRCCSRLVASSCGWCCVGGVGVARVCVGVVTLVVVVVCL